MTPNDTVKDPPYAPNEVGAVDYIPPGAIAATGPTDDANRGIVRSRLVTAVADGRVSRARILFVIVVHDGGWSSYYYHIALENMAEKDWTAEELSANNYRIGISLNAILARGDSTHSHVHLQILRDGVFQNMEIFDKDKFHARTAESAPRITLYEHANFGGRSLTLAASDVDFCNNFWDPNLPKSISALSTQMGILSIRVGRTMLLQ